MTMIIKPLTVLGLRGGASLDGIKAEIVSTDGVDIFHTENFRHFPYPEQLLAQICSIWGKKVTDPEYKSKIDAVELEFSAFLDQIVKEYIYEDHNAIDLIGLEGPTICHEPQNRYTYQLGKGRNLSQTFDIKVITHFHNADILNGGIGAPIMASYYQMLAQKFEKPVLFINLGGVSTIFYIGTLGEILAFDCGAGTAFIDDWIRRHVGGAMDYNGKLAALGKTDDRIISTLLRRDFFLKCPPKCIDRDEFARKVEHLEGLSPEDGAATATAFVSEAILDSVERFLPDLPQTAVLCGGGASNPTLTRMIRQKLKDKGIEIFTARELEMEINEAQAVAFLAARRIYNLPITFPATTGVLVPITGGEIYEKDNKE